MVSIHLADVASKPTISVKEVRAVAGKGLEGDRYYKNIGTYSNNPTPGREITLVETEAIEALKRDYGIKIEVGQARRNIVTRGIALNHLVGREFVVGEVKLRGIRLCEPCMHLEKLTRPGVKAALDHRGGLRADILKGGAIYVGDVIEAV